MRLINVSTYAFEEFNSTESVKYAILSHTWREDELLYADVAHGNRRLDSNKKVSYLCKKAQEHGLKYVWIDTVCIDKSSSAELSEAINSMYTWYKDATVCYVYLDDAKTIDDIKTCRWITRGWTLQEVIAPSNVGFYNADWVFLGSKKGLATSLSTWTGIDHIALCDSGCLSRISVATRMSWAATRSTTRIEDQAYCLLGIFEINMPLLYGEGSAAYIRLQQEIIRQSDDQSILVWRRDERSSGDILASEPSKFLGMRIVSEAHHGQNLEYVKGGLRLPIVKMNRTESKLKRDYNYCWGILTCRLQGDLDNRIAVALRRNGKLPGLGSHELSRWEIDSQHYGSRSPTNITLFSNPSQHAYKMVYLTPAIHNILSRDEDTPIPESDFHNICVLDLQDFKKFDVIYRDSVNGYFSRANRTAEAISQERQIVRFFFFIDQRKLDAFMVRFCDCWVRSLYGSIIVPADERPQVLMKPKPSGIDMETWVRDETESYVQQPITDPDNEIWKTVNGPASELNHELIIQNGRYLQGVKVKVMPFVIKHREHPVWKLKINVTWNE